LTIQQLIEKAESSGLTIRVEGDMIEVRAPQEPEGEARAIIEELRERKQEILEALNPEEEDPVLTPDQWYREFHRFHVVVVQETPDLDWKWLKEQRPELFQAIRQKEDELDGLGSAKLSEVDSLPRRVTMEPFFCLYFFVPL